MSTLLMSEDETMLQDAARGFLDGAAPVSHLRGLRDAGKTHDAKLWADMAAMGDALPDTADIVPPDSPLSPLPADA